MQTKNERREVAPFEIKPVKIQEVEISNHLPAVSALNMEGAQPYGRALILVRLHSQPLGLLMADFRTQHISADELAKMVWQELGERIDQHLQEDGLQPLDTLTVEGVPPSLQAKCIVERDNLLENAPRISIILATRDRVQSLALALDSIAALIYPNLEVVLVDSAPKNSDTEDFIKVNKDRFAAKNVCIRYVREDVPGLAVAHNRGLEAARGSIIAFTDDDVLVDKYWLVELLRGFESAENVGCVTGLVLPMELETPAQVLFEEFGGFTKGFEPHLYDLDGHRPQSALYPYTAGRFGTGANMAFKASYLNKVGGFDPALGAGTPTRGADDMAAFFHVIKDGYRLVYQPYAMVMHRHRRTYEELERQIYGYGSGLTAFLTKCIVDDPMSFFEIAARVPAGLRYAFAPNSNKNQHKSNQYPGELEGIERKGMLYGPFAYIKSRWKYRNPERTIARRRQEAASKAVHTADIEKSDR